MTVLTNDSEGSVYLDIKTVDFYEDMVVLRTEDGENITIQPDSIVRITCPKGKPENCEAE